jgi:hypothetical protein
MNIICEILRKLQREKTEETFGNSPYVSILFSFCKPYLNHSKKLSLHWWLTPVILVTWEAKFRRIEVDTSPNSSQHPMSKITRAKWVGGMAQAVEHLLCKL